MTKPTRDHLALLSSAYWRMSEMEYGAPEIDGKRPYGNSSVEEDLAEILPDLTMDERERTHEELVGVLRWISRTPAVHSALLALAPGSPGDRVEWNPAGEWKPATVEAVTLTRHGSVVRIRLDEDGEYLAVSATNLRPLDGAR
jgi:hypothetical protein